MPRTPVIKTVNLCRYYQLGTNVVKALDHINLEIYSGEFVVIYGPSGCGKSTFMSLVAGLDSPTSGEIFIRGEKLSTYNAQQQAKYRRTKIGMIFQQFNLINTMNIVDNVAMPLTFNREKIGPRRHRGQVLLEAMGLGKYLSHSPSELSGGQQQRVAIARALSSNPWILLCDEPTGNLDSRSSDEILKIITLLSRKSRRTILMITHNPDFLKYANRVVYFRDGSIWKIKVNKKLKAIGNEGEAWVPNLKAFQSNEEPEQKTSKTKEKQPVLEQADEPENNEDQQNENN